MPTVTFRIDDEIRTELQELARKNGTTVSALLHERINNLLGRKIEMPRHGVPVSISVQERYLLILIHETLALLYGDDPNKTNHHRKAIEILQKGYTGEYGLVFSEIKPEEHRSSL